MGLPQALIYEGLHRKSKMMQQKAEIKAYLAKWLELGETSTHSHGLFRLTREPSMNILHTQMCLHIYTNQRAAQSGCPAALGVESGWWYRRSHPPSLTPQSPKKSIVPVPPARQWSRHTHAVSREPGTLRTKMITEATNICFVRNRISGVSEGAGGLIREAIQWIWAKMKRWTTVKVQMLKKRQKRKIKKFYWAAKQRGCIINADPGAAASLSNSRERNEVCRQDQPARSPLSKRLS